MIHHGVSSALLIIQCPQNIPADMKLTQAADKTKKGEGEHNKGPGAGAEDAENNPHLEQVAGRS